MSKRAKIPIDLPWPMTERRCDIRIGRALHCCVVCEYLGPWSKEWSWYGSYREEDEGIPVQKFCSAKCAKNQKAVTLEMCADARMKEYENDGIPAFKENGATK